MWSEGTLPRVFFFLCCLWGISFFLNTLLFLFFPVILALRIIGKKRDKNHSKSLHFVKSSAMGFTTKKMPLQNETKKMGKNSQLGNVPSKYTKKVWAGLCGSLQYEVLCYMEDDDLFNFTCRSNSSGQYMNWLIIYALWMCCRSLSNASIVGTLPPAIGNLTNLLELWALHNCTSFIYNWVILCHICKLNTELPHWALSGAHFGVSLCALYATYIEPHNFACFDQVVN